MAHKWAKWLRHPCRLGDPRRFRAGGKIRSGPLVGKVATSTMPLRRSPPLQSRGQNQKWPTSGQSGYVTLAISGIPTAAERGAKSEVAHKWAKWLRHPCCLGDPRRFRAGGKIRSGPQVGKVAFLLLSFLVSKRKKKFVLSSLPSKKKFFFLLSFLLSKKKCFFYSVSQLSRNPTY